MSSGTLPLRRRNALRNTPRWRHDPRKRRLHLEQMEARRVLATVTWDGGGDGTSWEDPLNWDSDILPTSVDDVTINSSDSVALGSSQSVNSIDNDGTLLFATTAGVNRTLTLAAGMTNDGTLELNKEGGGTSLFVNVAAGTLTNNGTIRSSGSTGGRTVDGNVDNFGTIDVDYDLTITSTTGEVFNSQTGTLDVASPATLSFTGGNNALRNLASTTAFSGDGAVDFNDGTVVLESDVTAISPGPSWIFSSSVIINGPGKLTNQRDDMALNSETFNTDFENQGIVLVDGNATFNGTVDNLPTGVIRMANTTGVNRTLTLAAGMTNDGTLELNKEGGGTSVVVNVAAGTLTNNGTIRSSGSTGGRTVDGNVDNFGTIDVDYDLTITSTTGEVFNSQTGTLDVASPATLSFTGGNNALRNLASTTAFSGDGAVDFNDGTVVLESDVTAISPGPSWIFSSSVIINGPGKLTNQRDDMALNSETFNTDFENQGIVLVDGNATFNGTVDNLPTGVIRMANTTGVNRTLTLAAGMTNDGTLELNKEGGGTSVVVNVAAGTLTNNGTIRSSGSTGGRTIDGNVDNFGTIDVDYDLTITSTTGEVFNSQTGTLDVASPATLNFTGGNNALRNLASTTAFSGDGAVDFNDGTVVLESDVTAISPGPSWIFSSSVIINGPGKLTNQRDDMALNSETFNTDFENQGIVLVDGNATFNGTVDNLPTGVIQMANTTGVNRTLTLAAGMTNDGTLELNKEGGGTSVVVNVAAGTLTNNGTIRSSGSTGGRTVDGNVDNFGTIDVDYDLTIDNDSGSALISSGHVDIGSGILRVTGDYTQTATGQLTLRIIAAPTTPGADWAQLDVAGDVVLAGQLNLERDPGFVPAFGTVYPAIPSSTTRTGAFDSITGTDAGGGNLFTVQYRTDGFDVVVDINDPPVANGDSITVDEGATITMLDGGGTSLLDNDSDPNLPGDMLMVNPTLVLGPSHGVVVLNTDGTFSYTHDDSETLADSFVYEIFDNGGASSTATVAISVTPVNDNPPVATGDAATVTNGGTVTALLNGDASLLDNDSDVDLPHDTLTVSTTPVSGPNHAANFQLFADGTFSYTHDGSNSFSDTIVYEVSDTNGATAQGTLNIVINDPPIAQDDVATADKDHAITIEVLENDIDFDAVDTLTILSVNDATTLGSVQINLDGTIEYDANGQFDSLSFGQQATDTFEYTIADGRGGEATATVTVTVVNAFRELPDLNLIAADITFLPLNPDPGEPVQVQATIHNHGVTAADVPFEVVFQDFDTPIGLSGQVASLGPGASTVIVSDPISFATAGFRLISVSLDTIDVVTESNEQNNEANAVLQVGDPPAPTAQLAATVDPASGVTGQVVTVTGTGFYDFDVIPGTQDYPCQGCSVTVTVVDDSGPQDVTLGTYHGGHTDIEGNFSQRILAPVSDEGNPYRMDVAITDFTVEGAASGPLVVTPGMPVFVPPPSDPSVPPDPVPGDPVPGPVGCIDCGGGAVSGAEGPGGGANPNAFVFADHVFFSDFAPGLGDEMFVFVYFYYVGADPAMNVPVQLNDIFPVPISPVSGAPYELRSFTVGNAQVNFPSGGTDSPQVVVFPWTNTAEGSHILQAKYRPAVQSVIPTNNPLDDAATRLITVGPAEGDIDIEKSAVFSNDADANLVVSPGDMIEYSIEVTNTGANTLTDVRISDAFEHTLISQVTNVSGGGGVQMIDGAPTLIWDIPSLASGASETVTFEAVIAMLDHDVSLGNLAIVTSDQTTPEADAAPPIPIRTNQAPVVEDQTFSINENSLHGTVVGTILATDPNVNDTLTYEITGGPGASAFVVDLDTGEITVADSGQLDFEVNPSLSFLVDVTDHRGLTDTGIITVELNDVNETPNVADTMLAVDENQPPGTVVGSVVATDPDDAAQPFGMLSYAIIAGDSSGQFALASNGQITTTGSLDHETQDQFTLTVEVTDGGGLSDIATVTVDVQDLPEGGSLCLPQIDFESDPHGNPFVAGDFIAEQWAAWGVRVSSQDPVSQPLMVFDTANPSGGDDDLQTPGYGLDNDSPLGNVLIISEDGDSSDPDDNASGGTMVFTFDQPAFVDQLHLLDIDSGEPNTEVRAYRADNSLIATVPVPTLGDNSFQIIDLNLSDVARLELQLDASGALTNIVFCSSGTSDVRQIGDVVFHDANGDGLQDPGETGIADVLLQLVDATDQVIGTAVTNVDGFYAFSATDASYTVRVAAANFANGGTLEGAVSTSGGDQQNVTTSGSDRHDIDFGYELPGVTEVTMVADPVNSGQQMLLIEGTDGPDDVIVKAGGAPGTLRVIIDGQASADFGPGISRIVAYGEAGNDRIKVRDSVGQIPAELFGGRGDDRLRGGLADDVLVGGEGNDLLIGRDGRDLLIGGLGVDKAVGHNDDDILIGGVYIEQLNREALNQIITEWSRTDLDYLSRVANLRDGGGDSSYLLNDTSVFDDGERDVLRGRAGLDWFLADDEDDRVDVDLNEILTDVELDFATE